jgi:hypothetical protein
MDRGLCQPLARRHSANFEPGTEFDTIGATLLGSLRGLQGFNAKLKEKRRHAGVQMMQTSPRSAARAFNQAVEQSKLQSVRKADSQILTV